MMDNYEKLKPPEVKDARLKDIVFEVSKLGYLEPEDWLDIIDSIPFNVEKIEEESVTEEPKITFIGNKQSQRVGFAIRIKPDKAKETKKLDSPSKEHLDFEVMFPGWNREYEVINNNKLKDLLLDEIRQIDFSEVEEINDG